MEIESKVETQKQIQAGLVQREHIKLGHLVLPVCIIISKNESAYFMDNNKQMYNELLTDINNKLPQIIKTSKTIKSNKKLKQYSKVYHLIKTDQFKYMYNFEKNNIDYSFVCDISKNNDKFNGESLNITSIILNIYPCNINNDLNEYLLSNEALIEETSQKKKKQTKIKFNVI